MRLNITTLRNGDKGAAGFLVLADTADNVKKAVYTVHPRGCPDYYRTSTLYKPAQNDPIKAYQSINFQIKMNFETYA